MFDFLTGSSITWILVLLGLPDASPNWSVSAIFFLVFLGVSLQAYLCYLQPSCRGRRWSLLAWLPWTATLLLIVVWWVTLFLSLSGMSGDGSIAGVTVLFALVLVVPAAIFLVVAIKTRPPRSAFHWRAVVASLAVYLCAWIIIFTPTAIAYKNELFTIRIHLSDENGEPLRGKKVYVSTPSTGYYVYANDQGIASVRASKSRGASGSFPEERKHSWQYSYSYKGENILRAYYHRYGESLRARTEQREESIPLTLPVTDVYFKIEPADVK